MIGSRKFFETAVSVLPVGTGSIANELALALLSPPWGAIYCSSEAHIVVDEANGPEFFTGGAKLVDLPGDHGRIREESVREAASAFDPEDVHHPKPAVLSITQACECGTLYSPDDIRALGNVARDHGLSFHMDGARFANATAALDCSPAEITWKAGVDVLSFGATKNGCMAAEAIVLFGERRKDLPILRRLHKRAGQLYSKMRFISAQLAGYLDDANWLRWASHANGQAQRLAEGLCAVEGVSLIHPVEVNEVFLSMPLAVFDRLQTTGFRILSDPAHRQRHGVGAACHIIQHRPSRYRTADCRCERMAFRVWLTETPTFGSRTCKRLRHRRRRSPR